MQNITSTNEQNLLPGITQAYMQKLAFNKHNQEMNADGFYMFEDLSEDAKQRVLEKHCDINVDDSYWYEYALDYLTEKLDKIGFSSANIYFDLYRREVSFTFKSFDTEQILDTLLMMQKDYTSAKKLWRLIRLEDFCSIFDNISFNGRYASIDFNYYNDQLSQDEQDFLENIIDDLLCNFNHYILKTLESEYEYLTSEICISETLIANQYYFDDDGDIV